MKEMDIHVRLPVMDSIAYAWVVVGAGPGLICWVSARVLVRAAQVTPHNADKDG